MWGKETFYSYETMHMVTLYKIVDWLWLVFTALLWAFVISISFEQQQNYIVEGRYGMFGAPTEWIMSGLFIWVPVSAVLLLIRFICKKYIPESDRPRLGSKKAKLIFVALVAICTVIGVIINWLY